MRRALLLALLSACSHGSLAGRASVIDGDTITVHGERVRLFGIDAPEHGQTCTAGGLAYACGTSARDALAAHLRAGAVDCERRSTDRYGRTVAICRLDGEDVGAWMVRQGWALDYARYSRGKYAQEEAAARRARRGLWAGEFVPPARVRHAR
jgi:endonuclease YncB( thermonuclease family)